MAATFPTTANKNGWDILLAWAMILKQTKKHNQPRVGIATQAELRLDSQNRPDPSSIAIEKVIRNMTGGLGILGHDTAEAALDPDMQLSDFSFMHACLAHTVGRGNQLVEVKIVDSSNFQNFGDKRRMILDALETAGYISYIGNGSVLEKGKLGTREDFIANLNPTNIPLDDKEKGDIYDILNSAEQKTQMIAPASWNLESPDFIPLGVVDQVKLSKAEPEPVYAFLFKPSMATLDPNDVARLAKSSPIVLFAIERHGVTDVFYPDNGSIAGLESQKVLGEATYAFGKKLGLFEPEDSTGALIIQDCHGALATFAMVEDLNQYFIGQGYTPAVAWEKALNSTRRNNITTIHAPQPETVNRYGEQVVRTVYSPESANRLLKLGPTAGSWSVLDTLNLAMELSFGITCVSPNHLRLTLDPANNLVPPHFLERARAGRRLFRETSNIVNPNEWLPEEQTQLLDEVFPGWRSQPELFGRPEALGTLLFNPKWRSRLLEIQASGRKNLFEVLRARKEKNPDLFPAELDGDAIVIGAMRRATLYKLNLLLTLLETKTAGLKHIAQKYGPLLFLFGGLAPKGDSNAEAALSRLLERIKIINREGKGMLNAAFWVNYNEYNSRTVLQGVDMWGMFSDPLSEVTKSEAFGPSGGKASILGKLPIGFSDGWAPDFNLYGLGATIAPPFTLVQGLDVKTALTGVTRSWESQATAREIAMTGFLYHLGNLSALVRQERILMASGQGHLAPSLTLRTAAVINGFENMHPTLLLRKYRDLANDIRLIPDEIPLAT
ncbi:MAG: hypothetical protein NT099_06320 [Candidatus Saganbacteria bacterium]|nr:hypothetical protein [Candidatus Saganbacteria bacterium]